MTSEEMTRAMTGMTGLSITSSPVPQQCPVCHSPCWYYGDPYPGMVFCRCPTSAVRDYWPMSPAATFKVHVRYRVRGIGKALECHG